MKSPHIALEALTLETLALQTLARQTLALETPPNILKRHQPSPRLKALTLETLSNILKMKSPHPTLALVLVESIGGSVDEIIIITLIFLIKGVVSCNSSISQSFGTMGYSPAKLWILVPLPYRGLS